MHYTADDTQSAKHLNSFLLRWNYGNCFCSSTVFGLKILSLFFVNTFYCCVYLPCCLVILNYLLASKQLMYELMLTFAVASVKIIFEGKTNTSVNLGALVSGQIFSSVLLQNCSSKADYVLFNASLIICTIYWFCLGSCFVDIICNYKYLLKMLIFSFLEILQPGTAQLSPGISKNYKVQQ